METGRVIHRRYLLRRLIKQGQNCAVYQGVDQVLQRAVAVKSVPSSHVSVYKAAIRATSQFSHPNIIGLYDVITENDSLYIVQEYVEGEDFGSLLQRQMSPYEVADLGYQLCQGLLYAGAASRKVCHGDLTPSAVIRDQQGLVRINNFCLPSDLYYFNGWSIVGGDGIVVSDQELPWGQMSEARRGDDTRAVGLLLYQLLAGRVPGSMDIEPPEDGFLHFMRNIPAELCETIARAVMRKHPYYIGTPEALFAELKTLTELLEPPPVTENMSYQPEELVRVKQFSPIAAGSGGPEKLVSALPGSGDTGLRLSSYRSGVQTPQADVALAAPTMADASMKLAAARRAAYGEPQQMPANRPRSIFPLLLLIGVLVFALFFILGYFASNLFIH